MDEELDILAGEYVLGTLAGLELRRFQRRLLTDPAAVTAVNAWQDRLSPLLLSVTPTEPSAKLWLHVDDASRPANDNKRVRRWQIATAAAAMAALLSTGLALRPQIAPPPTPTVAQPAPSPLFRSVAALSETGGAPALLVTYDPATKKMRVMPVNVAPRPGHSLELWVIAGKAPPKSIGLMPDKGASALEQMALDLQQDMTIAVSVEPRGGSPTGLPTGPVIYSGQMVTLPSS